MVSILSKNIKNNNQTEKRTESNVFAKSLLKKMLPDGVHQKIIAKYTKFPDHLVAQFIELTTNNHIKE